ncbi:6-carboxyhexanoate--CoA ligase [Corynebacterium pseudotuberculosis]|uniref:6-carboxyhexanoate--CoA ligase n=1 Tax=Corynebacterium pseudotuberculosis TaxID=1719 RepID=UPI00059B70D6|nr:6-carboxyhexanoate--CoA ligase [Corynebacterium pseudotuberculosis]AFM07521.2 6-carboxyhexanoate--CoA ligase [Corynebacterium pseudotuberculosis Cp162]APG81746.1 6-carboxyhexanoate--CoA ligase [Corynebacterium pseudotuberculosis]WFP66348.1 6-carboxyhexanoate--CoA ligase [Corynebacterium pseudotuberculosis]
MTFYSVRMRASLQGQHISGAETLVSCPTDVPHLTAQFVERAMNHAKGVPDAITTKVESIPESDIQRVPRLLTREYQARDCHDAHGFVQQQLTTVCSAEVAQKAVDLLLTIRNMRGAILLDAHSARRLEPDHNRGIRASNFGDASSISAKPDNKEIGISKNHYHEALILSSKVMSAPGIIAEICISDDPDYTTGYVSLNGVYTRVHTMKRLGSPLGGRVFILDSEKASVATAINHIENTPVLIL